jgi:hypothetical protein
LRLTQTVWWNGDPDADGAAPFGRGDYLSWVCSAFGVPRSVIVRSSDLRLVEEQAWVIGDLRIRVDRC